MLIPKKKCFEVTENSKFVPKNIQNVSQVQMSSLTVYYYYFILQAAYQLYSLWISALLN